MSSWFDEQAGSGTFEMAAQARISKSAPALRESRKSDPNFTHAGCGGALVRWDPEIKQPRGYKICDKCKEIVKVDVF